MARLQFTGNSTWISKTLGLPSLLAGIALLMWNEYHQVHVARLFDEAEQSLTALTDTMRVDPALDRKMVYFDAWALVGDSVCDPLYGVGGDLLAVERKVEYHQWVQHQTSEEYVDRDGERQKRIRYYYLHEWCDKPVDSEKFHGDAGKRYRNFVLTDVTSTRVYSRGAHIGPYELSHELIDSAFAAPEGSVPFDPDDAMFQAAIDSTTYHGAVRCSLLGDTLYYGDRPYSSIVGDVRVIFKFYPACHAWVMAQQYGQQLRPFRASDGYWFTFFRFSADQFDPDSVFDQERWGQKMLCWTLRVMGWLLIVLGIKGIFSWVVGLFRWIPIIGPVFKLGLGAVAWVMGTIIALLTIGLAFVMVRPWLGWTIVGVIVAGLVGGSILYRRLHRPTPPPLPQPAAPQSPMPPTPPPLP